MRKSLAEVAEVREVTLITAVSMSKERRLSLKKANPVEVVVIQMVAVDFFFLLFLFFFFFFFFFFRGRRKTDGAPRGGGHQMSFCKTEVSKESQDGIESIYQSKIDSSLNSDSKVKEGVCYFFKSRLPTVEGTVNSRKVEVLRDTGCTC